MIAKQKRNEDLISPSRKIRPSRIEKNGGQSTESHVWSIAGEKPKDSFNFSLSISVLIRRREQNGRFFPLEGVKTRG